MACESYVDCIGNLAVTSGPERVELDLLARFLDEEELPSSKDMSFKHSTPDVNASFSAFQEDNKYDDCPSKLEELTYHLSTTNTCCYVTLSEIYSLESHDDLITCLWRCACCIFYYYLLDTTISSATTN